MAEENEILKKIESLKKDNPFKVPEDYFASLSGKIMDRIKTEDQNTSPTNEAEKKKSLSIRLLIRNQMAIAASFAALFILAYTAVRIINPNSAKTQISSDAIYASLQEDLYYIEENTLFELAIESEKDAKTNNNELTDQEIIDYLSTNGVELDLLTDF